MPTSVGILIFISMINTTSERFKARNFFICQYFSCCFLTSYNFMLSWVEHKKVLKPRGQITWPHEEYLFIITFFFFFFVWFDSLRPSQQSFSYIGMSLPGLNQYQARINMSCSRTQHSDAGEAQPRGPSVSSQALYHWTNALPSLP